MKTPYIDRTNVVARYRDRKLGRNTLLFGNDIEVDANSRSNGRSMFDGDMLIHADLMVTPWSSHIANNAGVRAGLHLPQAGY